jgi:NitT/TauT family transport system permease protein
METATDLVRTPAAAAPRPASQRLRALASQVLPPAVVLIGLAVLWEVAVIVRDISPIILPRPSAIIARLVTQPHRFFIENGLITFGEAVAGFIAGSAVALVMAAIMGRSRLIERALFPLAILVKATPIVVIAPLLVVWMGYGPLPKVVMAGLICYFPVLVNTIIGLRSVNPTSLEFFESVAASEMEIFWRLRVPHSFPYVLSAFKTAVSLAVIGAVVAEWAGAGVGLGRLIFIQASRLDQTSVFAGIFVLALMGISLTATVNWLEKRLLFWHESSLVD